MSLDSMKQARQRGIRVPSLRAAFCLLLATAALSLALPASAVAWDPEPLTTPADVVVLGDSISNAMGVTNPFIDAWPRRLARLGGVTVLNRSVGGDTSTRMVARFDADVASATPDVVVIVVGLNDLRRGVPMSVIQSNIRWMAERAKALGARPFIGTLTPLSSPWRPLEELNAWVREYATHTPGVGLIDFYRALEFPAGSGKTPFIAAGDWCHPNANGHWLMTLPALSAVVASGEPRPTSLLLNTLPTQALAPGGTYLIAGRLQADRVGLPGLQVVLQAATPGEHLADDVSASSAISTQTATNGAFSFRVRPRGQIRYRLRFEGSMLYAPSAPTPAIQLGPELSLNNPVAPGTVRAGSSVTVHGTLGPRHEAGTYPVELHLYRYVSGHWESRGHVRAKASDSPTCTTYSATLRLAEKGSWRLRAFAPEDDAHFSEWSPGFAYVTVE